MLHKKNSLSLPFNSHFPGGPALANTILDFVEAGWWRWCWQQEL